MGTAIEHPVPERVKPSFVIFFTSGHSDTQPWTSECPDVKIYKWFYLNHIYSCTDDYRNSGRHGLIDWLSRVLRLHEHNIQCESTPPPRGVLIFFIFFTNGWEFLIDFSHLLYVPIYARLQIFIQLSPILTKLCHIKRDYPVHIICSKCPCTIGQNACVDTFAYVIDSFVDRCLWQVTIK